DDLALGAAAAVHAADARHHPVAVQHLLHLPRPEEQVLPAVLAQQETETVLVPEHAAADQLEFPDDAPVAAPVRHALPVAPPRSDAPAEGFVLAFADVELPGQVPLLHRHAGLDQHVEDQFAAGYRVFITFRFAGAVGIAVAARGFAAGGGGFFRFFHLN